MIFDRPTSVELVEAVSEFLLKEIKTNLPAHLAFKTQIAINVLNIVRREQENKELLTKESKEILEDLLIAAHNDAKFKLKKKTSEEISKVTGGISLPPGFKLPF